MTHNDDIELRPALIFAFCKTPPLILFALTFLFLAWRLSPYCILFGIVVTSVAWIPALYHPGDWSVAYS